MGFTGARSESRSIRSEPILGKKQNRVWVMTSRDTRRISNRVGITQLKPTGSYRTDRRVNQKAAVATRRLFSLQRDSPQPLSPTSRAGRVSPAPARDSRPPPPKRDSSPQVSNSLSRAVSRVNDWSASTGRCRHGRARIIRETGTSAYFTMQRLPYVSFSETIVRFRLLAMTQVRDDQLRCQGLAS